MLVGAAVRELRLRQQISLRRLAAATGLSASFLSRLERDLTGVSVSNLRRIAIFLDVPLTRLLHSEQRAGAPESILRKGARQRIRLGNLQASMESLLPQDATQLEVVLTTAQPNFDGGHSHPHAGEELTFVVRGQIKYWVGRSEYILLNAEDAIFHTGDVPHRWMAIGDQESLVLSIGSVVYV